MATEEVSLSQERPLQTLDINSLIQEATWKDILIELVRKNKLDPWNIDISQVIEKYIEVVKTLKILDLRIPANIILAASVLLRLKSEMFSLIEEEELQETEQGFVREQLPQETFSYRLRLPPRRRMTLNELIVALEEAMKIKEIRETYKKDIPIDFPLKLENFDIEFEAERLFEEITKTIDAKKLTTFSTLRGSMQVDDILLHIFIPLLFLNNKGRIQLLQEKFFEEIFVAVV